MRHFKFGTKLTALTVLLLVVPAGLAEENTSAIEPKSRTFRFDYSATMRDLPEGATVRVWAPVPQTKRLPKDHVASF